MRKDVLKNFAKFTGKYLQTPGLHLYLKRDSGTGVFLWIFYEHHFCRTSLSDYFCISKKKNVYNILFIVIEQLPFACSFNTILHGGLMKFSFHQFPVVHFKVVLLTKFAELRAFRAYLPYVPTCLWLLDSYVSSCLKLFRVYVRSFFRCLLAYNDSQNILRLTSITCIAVFFWIIWPVVHFKTSKQTPASKTAYLNPILWDFVI